MSRHIRTYSAEMRKLRGFSVRIAKLEATRVIPALQIEVFSHASDTCCRPMLFIWFVV